MKQIKLILFPIFLFLFSCYTQDPDINLTITSSGWNAIITSEGIGEVHLNIAGSTDADIVTVKTYGDGAISDYQLTLDANKNFNEDVIIAFTHSPTTITAVQFNTVITAYKDGGRKMILLESQDLYYQPIDCCN
ncbi:MAG: hypothetical protein V1874_01270 [Spirochaetota bacterium]